MVEASMILYCDLNQTGRILKIRRTTTSTKIQPADMIDIICDHPRAQNFLFGHAFFHFPLAGKISRIQNFNKFPDSSENFVVDLLDYVCQPQTAVDQEFIDILRFFLQSRSTDRIFMICKSIEMGRNIFRIFEFYCSYTSLLQVLMLTQPINCNTGGLFRTARSSAPMRAAGSALLLYYRSIFNIVINFMFCWLRCCSINLASSFSTYPE